jgi:transcriptional regulator with XRE-family HTH domain
MKQHLLGWVPKIYAAKESAKAAGEITGDTDLSATVSEKLQQAGMKKVDRGAVNHWLKGARQPNVSQFIALCDALKVSPATILSDDPNKVVRIKARRARELDPPPGPPLDPEAEEIIAAIRQAEPSAQRVALAVAKAALEKSAPKSKKQKTKHA